MEKITKPTILPNLNVDQKTGFPELVDSDPETIYIEKVAFDASGNAVMDALNHGRSVTIQRGNSIIEVHPDGRTCIVKKLENSYIIPKKRIYHL
jgi:hypothetical protein